MRLQLNDKEVLLPSSLSEFTLGQRIDFHNQYGKELDMMLADILAMEEGFEKELEIAQFQFEKMFRTFAFFTGFSPDILKGSEFVDEIATIYHANLHALFTDENKIELKTEYLFDGELWELQAPVLQNGSKMKFGEFIDSKQVVKDMIDLGNGQWEAMLRLCAIYLRKKGEQYQEEFTYEGSDRMELMKKLPMDIALAVGFFLTGSMNSLINTLQSFSNQESKAPAGSARNTSTVGVG